MVYRADALPHDQLHVHGARHHEKADEESPDHGLPVEPLLEAVRDDQQVAIFVQFGVFAHVRALRSVGQDLIARAGEKAADGEDRRHDVIADDQADEQHTGAIEGGRAAVAEREALAQPADQEAEPEDAQARAVGGQVADGMQRPPGEPPVAEDQPGHDQGADRGMEHGPAPGAVLPGPCTVARR